jgi:protein disulfide-isomerase A6
MRSASLVVALFLVLTAGQAPEDPAEGVVDLTVANFDEHLNADTHLFIEFYAPWCGWCKKIAPTMSELGLAAKSTPDVIVAKFDATQADSQEIKSKFGIRGFPTILLLKKGDRENPVRFSGERTTKGFINFLRQNTGLPVGETTHEEIPANKPTPKMGTQATGGGAVIELSPENFDTIVTDPTKDVFVKFYAPWCGHCQKMAEAWDQLAAESPDVVIAKLDASKHTDIGSKFKVRGFPTLKYFSKADKSGDNVYKGGRDLNSLKDFVTKQSAGSE